MTDPAANRQRHIVLPRTYINEPFRAPQTGGSPPPSVPERDRHQHGTMLLGHLQQIRAMASRARSAQSAAGLRSGIGIQVEFVGQSDAPLAFESLSHGNGTGSCKANRTFKPSY